MEVIESLNDSFEDNYIGRIGGSFATEKEAEDFVCLDASVNRWFSVYRQVSARPLYTHPNKEMSKERYRYDVLLFPTQEVIDLGWKSGAIVIEIKKSDTKTGPAYSQAFDYVNSCAVDERIRGGVIVVPSYAFVFMASHNGGPLASLQAQNRFGCAWFDARWKHQWQFYCGHTKICRFNEMEFSIGKQDTGKKTGSR
jgi:hypothetical protein